MSRSPPTTSRSHGTSGPSRRTTTRTSSCCARPAAISAPTRGAPVRVASCRTTVTVTLTPHHPVAHLPAQRRNEPLDAVGDLAVAVELDILVATIFPLEPPQAGMQPRDHIGTNEKHGPAEIIQDAVVSFDGEGIEQSLVLVAVAAHLGGSP